MALFKITNKGREILKSEEIARLAGVSRSTVSRVINNYSNVPEETRLKVLRVIEEHQYMPNSYARTLAGKKSNTIGLFFIVRDGVKGGQRIFKNEYFTTYLELLVDLANARNYFALVSIVSDESEYKKVFQAFSEKRIDGGILIGTQEDTLKRIKAEKIKAPIVIFDYDAKDEEKNRFHNSPITIINSRDHEGIEKAVDYLYGLGHRDIGFIRGFQTARSGTSRYRAYEERMNQLKLVINKDFILDGDFQVASAYQSLKAAILRGKLPTAFVCGNDLMAIGAQKALQECGFNVPGHVSLVGFDNIHRAQEVVPKLTTIGANYEAMAQKAIQVLDEHIRGAGQVPELVEYGVEFFERESCARLNIGCLNK